MPNETTGIKETRYQCGSKGRMEAALEDLEQLHGSAKSRISAATFGAGCLLERALSPAHNRRRVTGRLSAETADATTRHGANEIVANSRWDRGYSYRRFVDMRSERCTRNQEVIYAR
jgi:hypothetical protein